MFNVGVSIKQVLTQMSEPAYSARIVTYKLVVTSYLYKFFSLTPINTLLAYFIGLTHLLLRLTLITNSTSY